MIKIDRKENCYGCTACEASCPVKAITMSADEEGFSYPTVDLTKCIDCDKCVRVCPKITDRPLHHVPKSVYGALNISDEEYMSSSSGGVFIELCRHVIENGGIAVGAIYDDQFNVIHAMADTLEQCRAFQGSKYTQSNINGILPQIKKKLTEGRLVLFSGTPCQIAGLKNYLGREYDNLITCDLICHGVPSPRLFKEYIHFLGQSGVIESINMKSKLPGNYRTNIRVDYNNGDSIRANLKTNIWNNLYFGHYAVRQSCSECPYTSEKRIGDITIGDFWGAHRKLDSVPKDKAISLILINTDRGKQIMDAIQSKLELTPSNLDDASQPSLHSPSMPSPRRAAFWHDYFEKGFGYIAKKYCGYTLSARIKESIKSIIR